MKRVPLRIELGLNPTTDETSLLSNYYTDGDKVRARGKSWEVVGGCLRVSTGSDSIEGCVRWGYNFVVDDNNTYTIISSDKKLYGLLGNRLTNITPLNTSTTTIANSLATNYATLSSNPIATINGSKSIVITWTSHKLIVGDTVSVSGAADTNGITAAQINTTLYVQAVTTNTFTATTAGTATSTGSGGGASVVVTTDLITVTQTSHGLTAGDRIKIASAADTGGILAASINVEHIVRVNTSSTYTFTCGGDYASSSVSSAGGASTTVQVEIDDGKCDQSSGYGYGMGLYGVGLYGVGKTGYYPVMPRIWSGAEFGNYLITTPGTTGNSIGAKIYQWDGDTSEAPTVVTNAPTNCNYVTVFKNIVFALCGRNAKWSDQGDQTVWSAAATNQAGEQPFYGVSRLISAKPLDEEMLIFSRSMVFRCTYIGKPYVFSFEKLEVSDGIIAPHAAVAYGGEMYWKGTDNFYRYRGGAVEPFIQGNTIKEYAFGNLNRNQASKTVAWLNSKYGEIWWFSPYGDDLESGNYEMYNVINQKWHYGTWTRSAVIENDVLDYPRLVGDNILYDHERGRNDDTVPLDWFIETNYGQIGNGEDSFEIQGLVPDGIQAESAKVTVYTKLSPQSTVVRTFGPYTIEASSDSADYKVDMRAHGKYRKYRFENNNNLESFMRAGAYYEMLELADSR